MTPPPRRPIPPEAMGTVGEASIIAPLLLALLPLLMFVAGVAIGHGVRP